MFKKIKQLFCRHYYPNDPILAFENELCRRYEIECVKCEHIESIEIFKYKEQK